MTMATATEIYSAVQSHYTAAATNRSSSGRYESTVAAAFGYSIDELASTPQDANLGLSCGNPIALAALREGETVVDLGCGAGFDVFQAAKKVGSTGRLIGVDVNDAMLEKAEKNKRQVGLKNVEFVKSPITEIAMDSHGVDCVISNCVINLVPEEEKHLVFKEIYRLLRPGGRVAISDILIKDDKPLPEHLKANVALLVGCIAGASFVGGYEKYLREAGFKEVLIVDNGKDLNVYTSDVDSDEPGCGSSNSTSRSCCGTSVGTTNAGGPAAISPELRQVNLNEHAGSFNIYAVKP
jgi:arsenite methyltransferase